MRAIQREDQETIIVELEGLAIAAGLHVFKELLKGKLLVVFLDLMPWIERVPSQSNPADILSREVIRTFMNRAHTEVDVAAMWRMCLEEK